MEKAKKLNHKIGVVSIGGPVPPDREKRALHNMSALGIEVFQPYSCSKFYADYTHDFANGSAEDRLSGIHTVLSDESISCILAARGATGSFDIIEQFPFESFGTRRKLLIGNSDVTSLLVQMPEKANIPAIHGATFGSSFADFYSEDSARESVETLIRMLRDESFRFQYQGKIVKSQTSRAEGKLLCGNLTMLVCLLGTPFDVSYENKILVLEEVGEPPYKVKRMLEQLYYAGKFSLLRGLCFGRFSKCHSPHVPVVEEIMRLFCDRKLSNFSFPILKDLEVGHWGKNVPIPIGCLACIEGDQLVQLESPIDSL